MPAPRKNARPAGVGPAARKPSTRTTRRGSANPPRQQPGSAMMEGKPTEITEQAVAEAAYFLWQQRGGDEIGNWLEAEAMLRAGGR